MQDIHEGALQCTESRMLRCQAAWKAHPPLFDGLDQLHLGRVTGIKTQGIRRKDHGIFIAACGFRDDAVQFPGIDEVEAFGMDRKLFHIDVQTESTAGKVEDFRLVMPVMLDKGAFSAGAGSVDRTGEGFCAVKADFFQR